MKSIQEHINYLKAEIKSREEANQRLFREILLLETVLQHADRNSSKNKRPHGIAK